tara:strand:- start:4628 stop:5536 length:909 start_codon:yes stop_codon:yes gene_type:complete
MNLKQGYGFVLKSIKKDKALKPIVEHLKNKTYVISGGTRGIGLEIGKTLSRLGANVAILGRTTEPHPKLEGTLESARKQIQVENTEKEHSVLSYKCDVRDYQEVQQAVQGVAERFGQINGVLLNASALCLAPTLKQTKKEVDLMTGVNINGSFFVGQACLKHIPENVPAHMLVIAPPLTMLDEPQWWTPHFYYSMSKFNMTLMARNWSQEFPNIGVNTLWPRTTIDTAPVRNLLGGAPMVDISRKVDIMGEAAKHIFLSDPTVCTGKHFIDDEVCVSRDVEVEQFRVNPHVNEKDLMPDFFC